MLVESKYKKKKNVYRMYRASQVALVVKNPPAMQEIQEMQVGPLGWEDPLEEGMATHVCLPGEPQRQRSLAGSFRAPKESYTTEVTEHTCIEHASLTSSI